MSHPAVLIEGLGFKYKDQPEQIFSGLNLRIEQGDRFGLFGPNGAGKTTLMSLMTGLITYTEGSIHIFGERVKPHHKAVNKLFGFVPQDFSFYHELTPQENLEFFGSWAGLDSATIKKRTDELLEVLGLADVKKKTVQKFSGGMKRRVNLAIAVMHHPKLLFLDEPTVGVDVQTRHSIIDYLKYLNSEGMTLVYTSHQLYEAESLCKHVAMIDSGKIIAHDSLSNLLAHHEQDGLEGLFLNLTGKAFRD